jgi:hypothetical protein
MANKYTGDWSTLGGGVGVDATGNGSLATPWATIQKGINTMDSGDVLMVAGGTYTETANNYLLFDTGQNGKSYTIRGVGDVILATSSTSYCIRLTSNMQTGSIVFDGITVSPSAGTSYGLIYNPVNVNLQFSDCVFTPYAANSRVIRFDALAVQTRTLTMTDCYVTSGSGTSSTYHIVDVAEAEFVGCDVNRSNSGNVVQVVGTNGVGSVTISDCNFVSESGYGVHVAGTIEHVNIEDSVITTARNTSAFGVYFGDVLGGTTRILHNTITAGQQGIFLGRSLSDVIVDENDIKIDHDTAANVGISVGLDAASNANPLATPTGKIVVSNNTVDFIGADNSHGILIGSGANRAFVYGNTSMNGDIQYVIKAEDVEFYDNYGIGRNPLLLKGASRAHIHHNTLISTGDYVIDLLVDTDTPDHPCIHHNILSGGEYSIYNDDIGVDNKIQCDHNCYFGYTLGIAMFDGAGIENGLSGLRSHWLTYSDMFPGNDINSVNVDPMLDGQYRPLNTSIWPFDLGAWRPTPPVQKLHQRRMGRGELTEADFGI